MSPGRRGPAQMTTRQLLLALSRGDPRGRRPKSLLLTACVCAAAVVLADLSLAAEGQKLTFTYSPPDGTAYLQTVVTTETFDFGAGRKRTTQEEMRLRTIIKRSPVGYREATTCLSIRELDRAAGADSGKRPLASALERTTLTYQLDAKGHLITVNGIDVLLKRVRAALSRDTAAGAGESFAREKLLANERADWERSVEQFVGRPAAVGEAWLRLEDWLGPTGQSVKCYAATKVVGKVKTAGHDCLRISLRYHTDPLKLREFLGDRAKAALSGAVPLASGAGMTGQGQVTLDPTTLLWYGASFTREVKTQIAVAGHGTLPVTIRQTKQYQYDYQKGT
jgi:hypothetical protein